MRDKVFGQAISHRRLRFTIIVFVLLQVGAAGAADVVPNGAFDSDLTDWTQAFAATDGDRSWDGSIGDVAPGSLRWLTNSGKRQNLEGTETTPLTATINAADLVYLSFYWRKEAAVTSANQATITARAVLPGGGGEVDLWTHTTTPNAGQVLQGNVNAQDVSSFFSADGTYELRFYFRARSGNSNGSWVQINIDDVEATMSPTLASEGTAQLGNVFFANEPVVLPVVTRGETVHWAITDFWEETVATGTEEIVDQFANPVV